MLYFIKKLQNNIETYQSRIYTANKHSDRSTPSHRERSYQTQSWSSHLYAYCHPSYLYKHILQMLNFYLYLTRILHSFYFTWWVLKKSYWEKLAFNFIVWFLKLTVKSSLKELYYIKNTIIICKLNLKLQTWNCIK